jgi:hypothetical protein
MKRDLPRTAPCAIICRGDGSSVGAIIDPHKWPHEGGVAGFGDTLPDALRDLAVSLEAEVGYVSEEMPSMGMVNAASMKGFRLEFATDHIWSMEDKEGFIGLRIDCGDAGVVYFTKSQARQVAEQLASFAGAD